MRNVKYGSRVDLEQLRSKRNSADLDLTLKNISDFSFFFYIIHTVFYQIHFYQIYQIFYRKKMILFCTFGSQDIYNTE